MPADFKSHFFQALLNAWGFIRVLAPYLVGGIVVAALANTFLRLDRPTKLLASRRWWVLPGAGLIGIVSPACTYGTVPLFAEMVRRGAPVAPAATFLIASALVNPQMFLLTVGALGVPIAIAQVAGALVFAVGIGTLASALQRRGIELASADLKPKTEHKGEHHKAAWPRRLWGNALDLAEFVGFYFVIGTIIAALAFEFVPQHVVVDWVGQGRWWATPFAAVVSVPTYVCGGGTIPFLAQATDMGMSSGAVLAFLIAGPATRVTALASLVVLFRRRVVVVYAVLLIVYATLFGWALSNALALPPGQRGLP